MKTEKEIEQLAEQYIEDSNFKHYDTLHHSIEDNTGDHYVYCGYIEGYTQCQEDMAKKYTKEDLENAFNSGRGYGVPDNIKDFNSFINSLNKQDNENI